MSEQLLKDLDITRSDSRLISRLLTLGVVEEDQVEDILRRGFTLAEAEADNGNSRGYTSLMKMLLTAVKVEQDERHFAIQKLTEYGLTGGEAEEALKPPPPQIVLKVPDNGRRLQ